ncbi:sensor histidine kinase [Nonomuraea ferruginea]|uniref:Sensor histidine kinase n=1 Tax=Nonomuraea ferruginea TaxID=46174 RepID=A0ABT4T9C9_9ACTN|nr:sensor histidine kinase [Nonomuraea ferruginea]MDA0645945.1 sensor histidine kinase [Nonomuraea ferruginea]
MNEIDRARRKTWWMLATLVGFLWLFTGTRVVLSALNGEPLSWARTVPAMILIAGFTWVYLRISAALTERRYPVREVAVAGATAVVTAAVGGADPMSFGFVLIAWLAVASLEVPSRVAILMAVGTFVTGVGLAYVTYLSDPGHLLGGDWSAGRNLLYLALMYGVFCAAFPPTNRVWMWLLTLTIQAHEGREAHTRLALAEERLRFSRDLHDLVGHRLSAIAVKAGLAVRLSDQDPAAARSQMAEVNELTRTALRELRQAVRGYRELDLTAELNSVKDVLEAAGIACHTRLPYRDLPGEVAPVFAYVVREAVTNVLKHSTATRCDILLRFTEDEAELRVHNDGAGTLDGAGTGSGLLGLEERVAAVGGEFTAGPDGDGGFLLTAVVSLPVRG